MLITNEDLLDIIAGASHRLHTEIKRAYKNGELENYLLSIEMGDLYPQEKGDPLYDTNPDGKILIFGDALIKENQIYGCLKEFGVKKERVELHLGYENAIRYPFNHLQYNPNVRLVLFGPVPHSGEGKLDKSSVITQLESGDGYPKVIRLTDDHGLKLTKTSLKRAINREVQSGYLAV